MKKLLLLSTIILGAFAAKADYTDLFKVYYDGKEVANGETIVCTNYTSAEMYIAELQIENQNKMETPVFIKYLYTGTPTKEEANTDIEKWGVVQVCEETGNCFTRVEEGQAITLPAPSDTPYYLMFEVQDCPKETVSKYGFFISDVFEGEDGYEPTPDPEDQFVMYITFAPTLEAKVDGLEIDENAPVEYYNLQGMKVIEPSNGIYIVKKGSKVYKQIISK